MTISGYQYDAGMYYVRVNHFTDPTGVSGERVHAHRHRNPHYTVCRAGRARVGLKLPNDKVMQFMEIGATDPGVHVPAEAEHVIECIEAPCVTECQFLHRDIHGSLAVKFSGNRGAYE